MEKIYLINQNFKASGDGTNTYGYRIVEAVKRYSDLPVSTINIGDFPFRWKLPVLDRTIKRFLYFKLNSKRLQNVHAINVFIIPPNKVKEYTHYVFITREYKIVVF